MFFFNDTATTEIYTLSLHDALPICAGLALEEHGGVGGGEQLEPRGERAHRRRLSHQAEEIVGRVQRNGGGAPHRLHAHARVAPRPHPPPPHHPPPPSPPPPPPPLPT